MHLVYIEHYMLLSQTATFFSVPGLLIFYRPEKNALFGEGKTEEAKRNVISS